LPDSWNLILSCPAFCSQKRLPTQIYCGTLGHFNNTSPSNN
jgi:hypothetical protein